MEPEPKNEVAVTTPVKLPSPETDSFDVGIVVPIPTEPVIKVSPVTWSSDVPVSITEPITTGPLVNVEIPATDMVLNDCHMDDTVPTKVPKNVVAVIIPEVLILIVELTLLEVVAVPVRSPTKPPVEVIIPEVLILAVVENPRAVVDVDAKPSKLPTKVVAVKYPILLHYQ